MKVIKEGNIEVAQLEPNDPNIKEDCKLEQLTCPEKSLCQCPIEGNAN